MTAKLNYVILEVAQQKFTNQMKTGHHNKEHFWKTK